MNGYPAQFINLIIGGLFALVNLLIGVLVHMHVKSDDEHRLQIHDELKMLRQRVHDQGNRISEALTRLRWMDEDSQKSDR